MFGGLLFEPEQHEKKDRCEFINHFHTRNGAVQCGKNCIKIIKPIPLLYHGSINNKQFRFVLRSRIT